MERNIRISVLFESGITWIYCIPVETTVVEFMEMTERDGGRFKRLRFMER